jgi:signal transduction histidine kinase
MAGRLASPPVRFAAFALLAIVVPAAVLAVLGFISLRQWETSSALLFREQSREMAAMAAEKVRMALARVDDAAVERIQAAVLREAPWEDSLAETLATTPVVRRLYVFDRSGALLSPTAPASETADLRDAVAVETSAQWESGGRRYVTVGERPFLIAVLRTASGARVMAVIERDPEVLRRDVLAPTLGSLEGHSVLAVLGPDERPVYAREEIAGADRVVTVGLGAEMSAWRLALYQPAGFSPRQAVRRQVWVFTAVFCLLLAVIVAGLLATYRLVRRETQMARLKADFVANVSHDLKTPLSLIRMFGETLEMGRLQDETQRQEYYRVITRESERLSRLIDNVLDFSRIDRGRRAYDFAPAAVEPLVRDTVESFSHVLSRQGFSTSVLVASDLPEVVMDADAVGQALANLIDNAIKYSGEHKALGVDARLRDGRLSLSVSDTGLGIPAEEHSRIFEKFYRVGRSETQARRGSGMGLALVRHIAEAHGGHVTLESRPGQGSRFTLWLPLDRTGPPASRSD